MHAGEDRPWLVLGASGAGKSTLLRFLGGLAKAESGEVLSLPPPGERGYLPQFPERALAGRNLAEDLAGAAAALDAARGADPANPRLDFFSAHLLREVS